jgi:hypothetical protein
MKKLFKSMFVMAALTSSLFLTSCKDETIDPNKESAAPTLTVNDGNVSTTVSQTIDTIFIKCLASADTDRKIKKLTITRAVTGGGTNTITQPIAYDAKDVIYTHKDVIAGFIAIDEGDVITYAVTIEDDKAKVTTKTYKVNISSVAVSDQILLGAPSNTVNLFRFFGTADRFRTYVAGITGANLAKENSSKIDFIFFYSSSGSTLNALYSPDYAFLVDQGWNAETATWPTKNKTSYKLTPITSSEFDALQGSTFITELDNIDFTVGTQDRVANLSIGQVLAYIKKGNNKRGFILVANPAVAINGQILLKVKAEL